MKIKCVHCIGLSGHADKCVRRAEAVASVVPCSNPAWTGEVEERYLAAPGKTKVGHARAASARFVVEVVKATSLDKDMVLVRWR
jgi:hypothetical protein